MDVYARSCERAAEFVSLELDGELSLFERALLQRHLHRCEQCAAYARRVKATTELLRAAPLEPIRVAAVWHVPRRSRRIVRSAAVTGAVAAAAIWLAVVSLQGSPQRVPTSGGTVAANQRTATDDRHDWSAGLPRSQQVIQQIPGGLYSGNLNN
jgi:predicted anti-sigma-YlaC factor YlaD